MIPLLDSPNPLDQQELTNPPAAVWASCWADVCRQHPDLAALIRVWGSLPHPVQRGILSIVQAHEKEGS